MGSLARPGPQFGSKGPPNPLAAEERAEPFGRWFWDFLKDELRPYPGRFTLVLRMTLAATLTMLAIMTFRLPGAAIAGYYTLLLSRESPITTVRSALTVLVAYVLGAAYTFLGVLLFIDYPLTHFLWVAFSILICFYVIRVTTNYVGSAAFAFIITIAIPIWDTTAPTAALAVSTLWAAGSVSVGLFCTVAVEYLLSSFETRGELHTGLASRTGAVSAYLRSLASDSADIGKRSERVQQLAMVGVSRLRRLAMSETSGETTPEGRSTTVALVGRMVDLAATLPHIHDELDEAAKQRLAALAGRFDLLERHLVQPQAAPDVPAASPAEGNPVLQELERTTDLLELSVSSTPQSALPMTGSERPAQTSTFVSDAFTNSEYLTYSLRGCLATMLCYAVLNAIAWRGLSTALATCVITALSSIGSSRQKQVLRLSGAVVGGLFFGIGSQVLILPMLDTIAGFTVLFVTVTFIAGWFSTASPRLSYFGLQIALAFYLIHLQEYYPQTNLAIARDRVMGIALGLLMMWLVFDTFGSKPAAVVMRDLFATNLGLLAELAQPWPDRQPADLQRLRQIRDTLSANFGSVNSQADAVLFEVGPRREEDLRLRHRLLAWQPRLRSIFFLEIGLLQYRVQASPAELRPEIVEAQERFDEMVRTVLKDMADAFSTRRSYERRADLRRAYQALEQAIQGAYQDRPTARAQGVLAYSSNIADLVQGLSTDLATDRACER